ncbi:MAG: D-alanyl-D-alanine carboxypeptidase/D-alanyl-D-alanine-endopeptidase [Actinomycetota bacterium]
MSLRSAGFRRAIVVLAGFGTAVAVSTGASAAPNATSAGNLSARVDAALAGSSAGTVGVRVEVSGLGVVTSHNAFAALPPASTQKSFVALTALDVLSPASPLRTAVRGPSVGSDGVVRGPLVLVGGGDPTLSSAHLGGLAAELRARGVRIVTGGLLGDDSLFDQVRSAPGWKPAFMPGESGPLSALVVDRNQWRWDTAYLRDPVVGNLDRFRAVLAKAGISVRGPDRRGTSRTATRQLATHDSLPMSALVAGMLKNSDNLAAEMLLKRLGATRGPGTTARGLTVVREHLASLGVSMGSAADGSGLSAYDRETPAGEVALLRAAEASVTGTTLRHSMSIGCVDGTLKHRFCGTPGSGRVFAKTGTLDFVRVLSGYTTTRSGRQVWFSFMLSGCRNGAACRVAIDRAVVALAAYPG